MFLKREMPWGRMLGTRLCVVSPQPKGSPGNPLLPLLGPCP